MPNRKEDKYIFNKYPCDATFIGDFNQCEPQHRTIKLKITSFNVYRAPHTNTNTHNKLMSDVTMIVIWKI